MCRPDHFSLEYEINPWMNRKVGINKAASKSQWRTLVKVYEENNCEIKTLDPVPGLPDLVFTANGGFVIGMKVLLSNFKYKERQGESLVFERWFKSNGYEVIKIPGDKVIEGQGEAFLVSGKIFAGYGFRSILGSHEFLKRIFKRDVVSLKLVDPMFYHLDTCFCPLRNGAVIYYPGAFNKPSISKIKKNFKKAVAVEKDDALDFFCNSVPISKILVTGATNFSKPAFQVAKNLGYRILPLDLSEFKKSGGGARCLTLNI